MRLIYFTFRNTTPLAVLEQTWVSLILGPLKVNFYWCDQISTHLIECTSFSLYLEYTSSIQFQLISMLFRRLECGEMCSNWSVYVMVNMFRAVYICYINFLLYKKAVHTEPNTLCNTCLSSGSTTWRGAWGYEMLVGKKHLHKNGLANSNKWCILCWLETCCPNSIKCTHWLVPDHWDP